MVLTRHSYENGKDYCFIFELMSFVLFFSNPEMVEQISKAMADAVVNEWNEQFQRTDSELSCAETKKIMNFDITETPKYNKTVREGAREFCRTVF